MRLTRILAAVAIVIGLAGGQRAEAANQPDPLTPAALQTELKRANAHIEAKRFSDAIRVLAAVVESNPRTANAWNLLGYSYRQQKDYRRALTNYKRALRIEPKHRGALEYLGELYLETDKLAEAKDIRSRLRAVCPDGCHELEDLEEAFAKHAGSDKSS